MNNLGEKKAPINYKYQQQQYQPPQDQFGKSFESEREYRVKLREQERQRINNQGGEEGLKYGALQIKPAEIIKPTDLIDHEYHFKSQNTQMQSNQLNGQIQYNPIDMNYLANIKNNFQQPHNRQNFNYEYQLNEPKFQNQGEDFQINERDHINNQIDFNLMQDQAFKRQKQIEYQEILNKQIAEKLQADSNQVQSPQQTGRIKQKLYSARKLSQSIDDPQKLQNVNAHLQNNQRIQNARMNSQNYEQRNYEIKQQDQFQQQQNIPIRRMGSFNQEQQLSGRESKQNDSLIFGGYLQIGNPELKDKQEKIRKQKEYREYLDMQNNQDKSRFENINLQKPPIPLGPDQINKNLNRPPSGIQRGQIPRQDIKNESFIKQGKSNWDEHFLQERRAQIGDQIFEQVIKKVPQNQILTLQNQNIKFSDQYIGQQNRSQSQQRQQAQSIDFKEQNPFVNQTEEANKKKEIDRKKQYAMELQKQINEKKQIKDRQNQNEESKPQKYQEPKVISQKELLFQNNKDALNYAQEAYSYPQEQQHFKNQNENMYNLQQSQDYQNEYKWEQHMENDPLFQQILQRKKLELMQKYQEDTQIEQKYSNQNISQQPYYFENEQKPPEIQQKSQQNDFKQIQIPLNQMTEAELKRLKREEYKRELDEQVRLKEQKKMLKKENIDKPIQQEQIVQTQQVTNDVVNRNQENDAGRFGVRNRTDITKMDNQETKETLIKKQAYQEELRIQMEEKQRQKEIEKERLKREEEQIERELQIQRQILEQKENKELQKEGKVIQDQKPKRQINRQQFETSDAITGQQSSNIVKIEQSNNLSIQEQMAIQDQSYIKQDNNIKLDYNFKQEIENQNLINKQDLLQDFGINHNHQQEHLYQPLKLNKISNFSPDPVQIDQQNIQMHQKLLEDQQKMIEMYQQALGQILNFKQSYIKESHDMQLAYMKERNQVIADLNVNYQNNPLNLGAGHQFDEIKRQENEISQLNAIQQQLNQLMNKVNANRQEKQIQFTSIINPQVQQNLNDLIKTQRDKIVRMSQTLNIKDDIQGVNDKSIIQNQYYNQFNQNDHNNQNKHQFDQFDQSLASNSKLIKVPNQFTNKLKEKADNFEQQRLLNISPNKVPLLANKQENIAFDNNSSWFEQQQKSGVSHQRIVSTNNMTNLYQTWQLAPESQASINQRASVSPIKNQYQKIMQASLAGSSHLQYINQNLEIQSQEYIQSPNHVQKNSLSPQSRQNFLGSHLNQRPLTNNKIYPQDTIEELPEREQNMEDDNSTYLDENHIINLADQTQPIVQNSNAFTKDKQAAPKYLPFQQNSNIKFKGFNQQQSIETDQDINNRDDEMTQYSKSVQNRKSKVFSSKNQGFPHQNQLEANMQYIEQQIKQGQIQGRSNSYSRSPLQNDQINNHLSPVAANQMINIGQVLANAQNYKPAIQVNTQKSFYKPPINAINQSNNNMAATGMAGAKPSITGSSFYNATMAKTKQQELNQEQELQKQLMKIFNSEILSNNDDEDQKSNIKFQNQLEDESKKQDSNQRVGQTQFRRKKQVKGNAHQQQFEDSEYLENASNINIAQSVAQSMDTNNNLFNFNQILQQPIQPNQAMKGPAIGQLNINNQKQISQRPLNQFQTQKATFKRDSIIDQQQYSWLMQNNNNIISEQQELEQSKSKSKDEEIVTEYENTVGQITQRPMQINYAQSQSQLESKQDFQRQNKSEMGQTNISEAIWDDPDILPNDENNDNVEKDYLESVTNKQSYIQEIYDQNSDAPMQFDGTNASNIPQFKIVSIKDENLQIGSLKSNFQNLNQKNNGLRLSNQQNLNQSYNTNIKQMNVQASQPYSVNQAYNFEPKEDSEIPTSLNHQYNFDDEHSEKRQMSSMKKNVIQKEKINIKNESAISGLNLCNGMFQESEPTSAAIIMNDKDFQNLKMYQPVLQTISDQEQDPVKKALDNELIDQIYQIRNQNRQSYKNIETSFQQKNMNLDQQQAERIQKNMLLLSQASSSNDNIKNMIPKGLYNPKSYDINTIKEEKENSSNFQTREVDPIINSTPSLIKIDSQESNDNNNQIQNQFKIDVKNTEIQTPLNIQKIMSDEQYSSHQIVQSSQKDSFQNNISVQQSFSNEQQSQNDDDFQEIIKEKLNKINNIFNYDQTENNLNSNDEQNIKQNNLQQVSTPSKNVIEIEKCTSPRPIKNTVSDVKNQELEDLARLIQQATGSVNNIVENSQQLMQSRQYDRMAAAKLRAKQKANISSQNNSNQENNINLQSQKIVQKKQEDNMQDRSLIQEEQKNIQEFQDKIENSQNDIKILSNLDQLIQNLEKQQQETIKFQNKFSSNKAYISQYQEEKKQDSNHDLEQFNINKSNIKKQYIEEEDLNNYQIKEILERNINNSQQKQKPNIYEIERMYTADNKLQNQKLGNINDSECNTEIKEAIKVDEKYQIKLQKQLIRPISGKSALSTSTNRYATSCQTQHVNINSNIKKNEKKVEYQEFNDDDDNSNNNYGHEQDSN